MCEFWLEVVKVLATPVVVGIFGLLLLRRIEGIKSEVAKQSDFHKKWAEQFFGCCQEFMSAIERQLSILVCLAGMKSNDELANELSKESKCLSITIIELETRIARSVFFAKTTGPAVTQAAESCYELLRSGLESKKVNPKDIIYKMNEFNVASRKAHEEMLGLSDKRA